MPLTETAVRDALERVRYPGFQRDVVRAGAIGAIEIDDARLRVEVVPGPQSDAATVSTLVAEIREALAPLAEARRVEVGLRGPGGGSPGLRMAGAARPRSPAVAGGLDRSLIPEVRHVVAVASGKGGVGKSTVAVNLAVALARAGARTGLLDADVYGPSIPLMLGLADARPRFAAERRIAPFERYGVRLMSLGFLIEDRDTAVIWRGPMVMKALEQLLGDVDWGALDVLVVDMPPGTGDAQLTMAQRVSLSGAIIVTTPQDVALADAIKGVAMFRKVDVPVLGIVENMSWFECPHCRARTEMFDQGGGRREAERLRVPFLGEIPLDPAIRAGGDAGRPIVAEEPDGPQGRAFQALARTLLDTLAVEPSETSDPGGGSLFERFRKVWSGPRPD
jgi:ATP-binding protein involved in chromosome partitioning